MDRKMIVNFIVIILLLLLVLVLRIMGIPNSICVIIAGFLGILCYFLKIIRFDFEI
ncbi:hypothetical protein MmiHf6_13860 [Methanimicrococcus hongohii]|uniref:Uncharacterized protein n=1 Tax=Methanimicrococcus hongohii TaxID=3028295 RepID=A0AA96V9Q5_9EURY|nr:hypothetical protein MmiHf6_13860 [Methanimicrococcus sp. Hf6]